MTIGGAGVWVYDLVTCRLPLREQVAAHAIALDTVRDSLMKVHAESEQLQEENRWFHLIFPPESGIFYPSSFYRQFYLYGNTRGKFLSLSFSANKYFEHRRRTQGTGFQRIADASTPHETFLYEILDSLRVVPNDSAHNDQSAQKILNFVNGIPYHDKEQYYVKMPIETLAEGRGNCADLSVLMHSLMITAGLDALLSFPTEGDTLDHAMVGVHGDFNEDRTRTYFWYPDSNGKKYYLCQPTGTTDMRYPVMHKVGYAARYPYTMVYKDSISVVENKKEWLKRPAKKKK